MLPGESNLEIRTCLPARANGSGGKPPLLFVHGGYFDAWCWAPHFLPWFAAKGYASHALSLRSVSYHGERAKKNRGESGKAQRLSPFTMATREGGPLMSHLGRSVFQGTPVQ